MFGAQGLFTSGDIVNHGSIGGVTVGINLDYLTSATHKLFNSGSIDDGDFGVRHHDGVLLLTNTGTISGNQSVGIDVGSLGAATIRNSGKLLGDVVLGGDADTVTNYIKTGHTLKSGKIAGVIDLKAGDDHFFGGIHAETLRDSGGADVYKFGGGDDVYLANPSVGTDGADTVNGGGGSDTYVVTGAAALDINLDSVVHLGKAAQTAHIAAVAADDTVTGFENVVGGDGADTIIGSNGKNVLNGGANADTLAGLKGADLLTGGDGNDSFHYLALSDSGLKAATRDVIADFVQGQDAFDFTGLEAALSISIGFIDTQAFHHNGTAEMRYGASGGDTLVVLDANGDGKADLSILLKGSFTLTGGDFNF